MFTAGRQTAGFHVLNNMWIDDASITSGLLQSSPLSSVLSIDNEIHDDDFRNPRRIVRCSMTETRREQATANLFNPPSVNTTKALTS